MRLHRLEAARGFAATYVVAHHALPHDLPLFGVNIGFFLRFGQEAVILFFLLSGFVIHYSYARRPLTTSEYFFNRICRIFLPLLPVLLLSYSLSALAAGRLVDIDIGPLIGNLLMLQDVSSLKPGVVVEPYMGNTPLWSLSYEWWFYVVYIVLMKTVLRVELQTGIVALLGAACAIIYFSHPIWLFRVGFYLSIWWCGVLLADQYLRNNQRCVPSSSFFAVISPVLMVMALLVLGAWHSGALRSASRLGTHPILELRHFLAAVTFVAIAYVWQAINWRGFSYLFLPFSFVAPISYGIYISHGPFLQLPTLLGAQPQSAAALGASLMAIVVFSALIELWFYPRIREQLRFFQLSSKLPPEHNRTS